MWPQNLCQTWILHLAMIWMTLLSGVGIYISTCHMFFPTHLRCSWVNHILTCRQQSLALSKEQIFKEANMLMYQVSLMAWCDKKWKIYSCIIWDEPYTTLNISDFFGGAFCWLNFSFSYIKVYSTQMSFFNLFL